jgi:hypothetical protein
VPVYLADPDATVADHSPTQQPSFGKSPSAAES